MHGTFAMKLIIVEINEKILPQIQFTLDGAIMEVGCLLWRVSGNSVAGGEAAGVRAGGTRME